MSELELLEGLKPCPFRGQPIAKKPYTRATNNTHLRQGGYQM